MTVERCVSDVILVDNALNKLMLNPKLKIQNIQMSPNDQGKVQIERDHKVTTDEAQDLQEVTNGEDDPRKPNKSAAKALSFHKTKIPPPTAGK